MASTFDDLTAVEESVGGTVIGEDAEKKELIAENQFAVAHNSVAVIDHNAASNVENKEQTIEEMCLHLARGYKFAPFDNELIVHYLLKKIMDEPLPLNIIKEIDLYKHDPDELPIKEFRHGFTGEAYYFTSTERKHSSRASRAVSKRTAKNGYWKGTGVDTMIFHEKQIIGFKKIMVFYRGKAPHGIKTSYVMHEYRVNPMILSDGTLNSKAHKYVVCRIHNKDIEPDPIIIQNKDMESDPTLIISDP